MGNFLSGNFVEDKAQCTQLNHIETAYNINRIIISIYILAMFCVGTFVCVEIEIGVGLGVLFGGIISGALDLFFSKILFGFLCDVKIIRNSIEKLTLTNNDEVKISTKKIRCYKCNTEFECAEDEQIIRCQKCGARLINPYYKENNH